MDRAAAGLVQLVTDEHRKFAAKPSYQAVVELVEFNKVGTARDLPRSPAGDGRDLEGRGRRSQR
jgi:hypothetical protein